MSGTGVTWCNATPAGASWPVCARMPHNPDEPHESADFWWMDGEEHYHLKRDEGD